MSVESWTNLWLNYVVLMDQPTPRIREIISGSSWIELENADAALRRRRRPCRALELADSGAGCRLPDAGLIWVVRPAASRVDLRPTTSSSSWSTSACPVDPAPSSRSLRCLVGADCRGAAKNQLVSVTIDLAGTGNAAGSCPLG